jgi:hypothetical protein
MSMLFKKLKETLKMLNTLQYLRKNGLPATCTVSVTAAASYCVSKALPAIAKGTDFLGKTYVALSAHIPEHLIDTNASHIFPWITATAVIARLFEKAIGTKTDNFAAKFIGSQICATVLVSQGSQMLASYGLMAAAAPSASTLLISSSLAALAVKAAMKTISSGMKALRDMQHQAELNDKAKIPQNEESGPSESIKGSSS